MSPTTKGESTGRVTTRDQVLDRVVKVETALIGPRMNGVDVVLVLVIAAALMVGAASAPDVLLMSIVGLLALVLLSLRVLRR